MKRSERLAKFEETNQVAAALIAAQRAARNAKTARLRGIRLAAVASDAAASDLVEELGRDPVYRCRDR
jgi:hypothetical protein